MSNNYQEQEGNNEAWEPSKFSNPCHLIRLSMKMFQKHFEKHTLDTRKYARLSDLDKLFSKIIAIDNGQLWSIEF